MPWLYATLVVATVGAAVLLWTRARFAEDVAVPHGIYAAAELASGYHAHRHKHGEWPAPGTVAAKEVAYVRTFERDAMRVDVFDFGGGQYVHFEMHGNGRLLALPVKRDEGAPGGAP